MGGAKLRGILYFRASMPSTFKYLITVLLALGFICNGLAQQASLDSLARDLSDLVFDYDPRAEQWVDSLQEQGIGREHKALQHTIGNYYYLNGIYDSALVSYKRALKLAEEEGDSARVLSLTNNVGVALIELGRLSEAVAYLRAVLDIAQGYNIGGRIIGLGSTPPRGVSVGPVVPSEVMLIENSQ